MHGFAAGREGDHCRERGDTNTTVLEMQRVKEREEEWNRGACRHAQPEPVPVPVPGLAGFAQKLARSISGRRHRRCTVSVNSGPRRFPSALPLLLLPYFPLLIFTQH